MWLGQHFLTNNKHLTLAGTPAFVSTTFLSKGKGRHGRKGFERQGGEFCCQGIGVFGYLMPLLMLQISGYAYVYLCLHIYGKARMLGRDQPVVSWVAWMVLSLPSSLWALRTLVAFARVQPCVLKQPRGNRTHGPSWPRILGAPQRFQHT